MAVKRVGRKPKAKGPQARPRAEAAAARELRLRLAREAKRRREAREARKIERELEEKREARRLAREAKKRREAREARKLARELEEKREARNLKRRERAAQEKLDLQQKQRRAAARVRKIRAAAALVAEDARRKAKNQRRRDERRMKREGKLVERLVASAPPRPEHPIASKEDLVTAEVVISLLKTELRRAAEHAEGRYRTHLYEETGDIDGLVWRETVDGEIGTTLGNMGDAFKPLITGLFYRETFFQGIATFTVSRSDEARMRAKGDQSPLDESRLGPNGQHYRTANTYWFKGDAQKAIATIEYMIGNVQAKHPEYDLVKVGLRTYWSPVERRPER